MQRLVRVRRVDYRTVAMMRLTTLIAAVLALIGCTNGGQAGKPLDTNAFFRQEPIPNERRGPVQDRHDPLLYDTVRIDLINPDSRVEPMAGESVSVSETVRESVTSSDTHAQNGATPSTRPGKPQPPPVTQGGFQLLGAVVVSVDDKAIFADKVVQTLEPVLSAKAKQVDAARFRAVAMGEVQKQVQVLVRDELEFAAAERNLDAQDRKIASYMTEQWRQSQIRKAGGSLELARQRAAADGADFQEMVDDRYKLEMRRIYFQKKEFPKIQVTADDMRRFYNKHLNDMFTDRDQAQFRVIRIGIVQTGGRDKAYAKVKDLHDRAKRGEDFATMASATNDDKMLMKNGGAVGMIDRGAYSNQTLEVAVWRIQPGEITEIVETPDAFFIAKLEQRKVGRVMPFEEQEVQARIRKILEAEQFTALREKTLVKLMQEAIIYPDPANFQPAVDIAMQRYAAWAASD
ncbi:MAG: peptidylprolyl isomerase [Tepidisphaeraceae bacterium]